MLPCSRIVAHARWRQNVLMCLIVFVCQVNKNPDLNPHNQALEEVFPSVVAETLASVHAAYMGNSDTPVHARHFPGFDVLC